jgi:hypothetical protein
MVSNFPEDMLSTWRELITTEMDKRGESFDDCVACSLSQEELDAKFYDGMGVTEGKPFMLWTHNRVYFSVAEEGGEWVESVPRNPSMTESFSHIGHGCNY